MFGNVDVKVRPLKLAYLVDPRSPAQVREAIRLSSTLWGGAYFPIIRLHRRRPAAWTEKPLPSPSAETIILRYLETFDPDILVHLSATVPSFISDAGLSIIKSHQVWAPLDKKSSFSPAYGIGIFEVLADVFRRHFRYKAKYPLRVIIPNLPQKHALFWASLWGDFSPPIRALLEERCFEALEVQAVDVSMEHLSDLTAEDVLFPARMAQWGLSPSGRSSRGQNAYVYLLDAESVEDVVDFWNLRALGKEVLPIPRQLKDDPHLRSLVTAFLRRHRRPWRHDPTVCDFATFIRGRRCTLDEMKHYASSLELEPEPNAPSLDPFYALQPWHPRMWDSEPFDVYGQEEEATDVKDLTVYVRAVPPVLAESLAFSGSPRCANEVSFRLYGPRDYLAEVFPRFSGKAFNRAISGLTSFQGDWRIGRHGLVKLVKDDFREWCHVPLAEAVFFAWLTDKGWKPQLSSAGLLAKQIFKQLDGNPSELRNESLLKLFEHMSGGNVAGSGYDDTKEERISYERDLPVGEVKGKLRDSSELQDLHGYLVSRGVFKLGLRAQCPQCSRRSWYALDDLCDVLTCQRCLRAFPAIEQIGRDWRYKTVGPFSVPGYANGAYAVLLALAFFDEHRQYTLRTTPVVSFGAESVDKKTIEADLGLFWQESNSRGRTTEGVLFGECKTYGDFEQRDFDRMRLLASSFPGAILLFSTLKRTLKDSEKKEMARIARAGRKHGRLKSWKPPTPINPVLVLTGTELLTRSAPPYCWNTSLQNTYSHMKGLLDVCDATQQIYLGLPPWQR